MRLFISWILSLGVLAIQCAQGLVEAQPGNVIRTIEYVERLHDSSLLGMNKERTELYYSALQLLPNKDMSIIVQTLSRKALFYLIENMPDPDVKHPRISANFLATLVVKKVKKRLNRWKSIPWNIFVEFVLPYASLSEPRDESLSESFMTKLEGYVDGLLAPDQTLSDAALTLNRKGYAFTNPPIVFVAAPPNKVNAYSPYEVARNKSASCTGESVFLVHALRLAGIPARVAGVPHWNRGSQICPKGDASPACGNHNWVEVYTEKNEWAFLDQNTATGINEAWFVPTFTNELVDGDKMHSIYAATWSAKSSVHFPLVFDPKYHYVSAVHRTKWYQSMSLTKRSEAGAFVSVD